MNTQPTLGVATGLPAISNNSVDLLESKWKNCKTQIISTQQECLNCHEIYEVDRRPLTCGLRYCKKCYSERLSKSRKRVFAYKKYLTNNVRHLILTAPPYTPKKTLELWKTLLLKQLRKQGYCCDGLSCVDLNIHDCQIRWHVHIALNRHGKEIPIREIVSFWKTITNGKAEYCYIKLAKRNCVLNYFAKRIAGLMGHTGSTPYYFEEKISIEQYAKMFHNKRYLTCLGSFTKIKLPPLFITSAPVSPTNCRHCGSDQVIFTHTIEDNPDYEPSWVHDPPPPMKLDLFCQKIGVLHTNENTR